MPSKRYRVFVWIGPLLFLNWLSLALLEPRLPGLRYAMLGYFLGSLFAHPTLAAAWTAFGPAPLAWRVPLSLVWAMLPPVAFGINLGLHVGLDSAIFIMGGCLLGQWLLLQFPFWAIALIFGLGLRHIDDANQECDAERIRFGIRHLLIVMVVVSFVLGTGRIIVPNISVHGDGPIFVFLAIASIVLTVPLLLAALMRRMAIPGVLLALMMTGVATALELPLMNFVGASGPGTGDFIAINIGSAVFILVIAGIVRMNGYCLYARPATG